MNVIISHDVDHITAWEHNKDLILPKHIIRNCIEFGLRYISHEELLKRFRDILRNRWNNLEAMMKFDKEQTVPSTFFFGVQNGLGLSYSLRDAAFWINKAIEEDFSVGVHGIAFERLEDISEEHYTFARTTKLTDFGIRMHYLRRTAETLRYLDKAGYGFDSSFPGIESPYKVGGLWEFPLQIMDGNIMSRNNRWQDRTLSQAKDGTKAILEDAVNHDFKYFTVLLHDRYFSDSFATWREWYVWLINYLKDNKFEFINYTDAIKELEKQS